ncbi:hypothetical protein [Tardiphaga sp.]|uniref:hypothetical protein n=1 Tax=Tardiphaga sp. TaxID=1926292 RepID=UPI00260DBBD2|nr:hypothetical protein [Tardiphaga sp.]MDB5615939.1 hypothetical protein [Tardiphaga sp.]
MVPTAYLREQAEKCRRLARDAGDPATRTRLEVLASEYEAQANFQDDHAPGTQRRIGPSAE